jgi:hypothetical protein
MDRMKAELPVFLASLRSNVETTDGVRASRVQHAVEDGHADNRLSLLAREAICSAFEVMLSPSQRSHVDPFGFGHGIRSLTSVRA